jgi:hypothetical protein
MNDFIRPRAYYGSRKNGGTAQGVSLGDLRELAKSAYEFYDHAGYLVEAFGFECVDAGFEPGFAGSNVDAYAKVALQSTSIWPVAEKYQTWDEDDIFTLIEFLYDHVSKPLKREMHSWNGCGYHYSNFNKDLGREEYRERLNVVLAQYGEGWELQYNGEILSVPPAGMQTLIGAPLPTSDRTTRQKVEEATHKFRRHGASITDRQDAVRDLADVLEWLRPQIKAALLKEDEQELFNIANNFGIRHMNQRQRLQYDKAVWLSWMFYHYLNTIYAFLHILKRQGITV